MSQQKPLDNQLNLKRLLGSWELFSFTNFLENGETYYPAGKDAQGRLIYASDGFVSVHIARRAPLGSQGSPSTTVTDQDMISAYGSFWSYCGRFEVSGDTVTHVVELSNLSHLTGTRQVRFIRFEDNRLFLTNSQSVTPDGRPETSVIVWKK